MNTSITLTAKTTSEGDTGFLVSLNTQGDQADVLLNRRFYSFAELPPEHVSHTQFWAGVLCYVAAYLASDDTIIRL